VVDETFEVHDTFWSAFFEVDELNSRYSSPTRPIKNHSRKILKEMRLLPHNLDRQQEHPSYSPSEQSSMEESYRTRRPTLSFLDVHEGAFATVQAKYKQGHLQ
jgi:hypothetical protein